MSLEVYCSEGCLLDEYNYQLGPEVIELEEAAYCVACDERLLQGYSYFITELTAKQLEGNKH